MNLDVLKSTSKDSIQAGTISTENVIFKLSVMAH